MIIAGAGIVICLLFYPPYWQIDTSDLFTDIPTGITENGHPWIGAHNPTLTIEEFSDYQCFHCYKMHFTIRKLIKEHPGKIRLVHRHYPMDHQVNPMVVPTPFHIGSGKMAKFAIYAATKGKFWEMNDLLFKLGRTKQPFNTRYFREATGLSPKELTASISDPKIDHLLKFDIFVGLKKRIMATPTFLIDEAVYVGYIPTEIILEGIK